MIRGPAQFEWVLFLLNGGCGFVEGWRFIFDFSVFSKINPLSHFSKRKNLNNNLHSIKQSRHSSFLYYIIRRSFRLVVRHRVDPLDRHPSCLRQVRPFVEEVQSEFLHLRSVCRQSNFLCHQNRQPIERSE